MSKLVRITITLPRDVLDAADREAKRLDRSRSRVVAEALRRYVGTPLAVREPVTIVDAAAEVAEARRRHLSSDLTLSPTERLRRAEELAQVARHVRGRRARRQIIAFDSYEDFDRWKKAQRAGA
jgi:metal-responsive CopG/Arc/MetJ family transcriptional regulator